MTTPLGELTIGRATAARISLARSTRETTITITLGLDGTGATSVDTGIGFYDHLLGSLAHHGLFDLAISADGDLQIDEHHTVEDVALVLGAAFAEALGDRAGIARFGRAPCPMDESLATATVDVGGRPYAVLDLAVPRRAGRRRCRSSSSSTPWRPSPGRPAPPCTCRGTGPQRPPPRRGRVQGARPRAARRPASVDPRRAGVASTKGALG